MTQSKPDQVLDFHALVEHFTNNQPVTQDMQSTLLADEMQLAADAITAALNEIERLNASLRNCLNIIDGLIEESGRSIEYGEEDPFRRGEWFDDDDMLVILAARAALKGAGT